MQTSGMPAVSAVIAACNAEETLDRCLDSLAGQTLKDIEIIVVDDGSDDGTLALARKRARQDRRMRVYASPREGIGPARNKGMMTARGEYLVFPGAGDAYDPDALEKAYACASQRGADIVFFGFRAEDRQGQTTEGCGVAESCLPNVSLAGGRLVFSMTNPAPQNKMFRRRFIQEERLAFPALLKSGEAAFCWCAFAAARSIFCLYGDCMTSMLGARTAGVPSALAGCLADAGRKTEEFLCRTGRADMLENFFPALAKNLVLEYASIPQQADGAPYLKKVLEFLPGRWMGPFWNGLKRLAAGRPELSPFSEDVLKSVARPKATVAVYAKEDAGAAAAALRGVLAQTLQDIEVIGIDDGQSGAFEAMQEAASGDPRVLLCRTGGWGQEDAGKLALMLARGRFPIFLGEKRFYKSRTALMEIYAQALFLRERSKGFLFQAS